MNQIIKITKLSVLAIIIASTSSCSKSRLSEYIYCERNAITHQNIIHASSSCPKIRNGYKLKMTSYYKFTEGFDVFCSECCYEDDAIRIAKGENLQ
jgi:hypothetical protein